MSVLKGEYVDATLEPYIRKISQGDSGKLLVNYQAGDTFLDMSTWTFAVNDFSRWLVDFDEDEEKITSWSAFQPPAGEGFSPATGNDISVAKVDNNNYGLTYPANLWPWAIPFRKNSRQERYQRNATPTMPAVYMTVKETRGNGIIRNRAFWFLVQT